MGIVKLIMIMSLLEMMMIMMMIYDDIYDYDHDIIISLLLDEDYYTHFIQMMMI